MNDAGTQVTAAGVTPGRAAILQNSQCSINVGQSSAAGSGNTLTLKVAVTFKASVTAGQTVFGLASDNSNLNSGWRMLGSWKR